MDSIDLLARKIADLYMQNRNPPSTSLRMGRVVETNPLAVQWGDSIILKADKLIMPRIFTDGLQIPNRWQDANGNMVDDTVLWKIPLSVGDQLILAPDEYLQMWYVIDLV
ncbi:DUF2577 family protein [Paenibacillus sp. TAB 01]|uniref:DUF2577 family protein n=1 Tax=Paenibacillus sp. TAB 01 TaxID=3368988 RepID=UPI0037530CEB